MANLVVRTITTAPQKILSSNKYRTSLWIQNTHAANNLYIAPSSHVMPTYGWLIRPYGHISINKWDGDQPEAQYWAYSSAAGTICVCMEHYGVRSLEVNITIKQPESPQEPKKSDPDVAKRFRKIRRRARIRGIQG